MFTSEITALRTYVARGYDLRIGYWNKDGRDMMQAEVINTQDNTIAATSDVMPYDESHRELVGKWARLIAHNHNISWHLFCVARSA